MRKWTGIYILSLAIIAFAMGCVPYVDKNLSTLSTILSAILTQASDRQGASIWFGFHENIKEPIAPFLLQLGVIVVVSRALGSLLSHLGQPAVIAEVTAGILLGPSLLGWLWPDAATLIFPKESLANLQLLGQFGICLFMFVVGLDLDVGYLRHRTQTALVVSHSSIVAPFLLGVVIALMLFPSFAAPGTSFVAFALFLGIAMSITAFPVLARILEERQLTNTHIGQMAVACAAANDAAAWVMLAAVVAFVRARGVVSAFMGFLLLISFIVVMIYAVRPLLARYFGASHSLSSNESAATRGTLASVLVLITTASLATQTIGLHALFGAFLAGAVMPRSAAVCRNVRVQLENFACVCCLPAFFAFSGLRTQIGLLNDPMSWLICGGIVLAATAGKLAGCMLPARLMGMSWNEAFRLGALMNTRGLVELIVLNVGYDLGILPPRIFSMLVIMALITTFMTSPLLNLAQQLRERHNPSYAAPA